MAIKIQIRRGTAAQWAAANSVLAPGEQGLETDTGRLKVGDGATAWAGLGYFDAIDAEPRIAANTSAIARVDPGAAGTVGQPLRQGPTGPAWGRRVISADWYSDINDAITAAGQGGFVELSPNVTYTQSTPVQLIPGITIDGDRDTSTITGPGIVVKTPASMCDRVTLRNFRVIGSSGATVGVDARGLTRGYIEGLDVAGYSDAAVWFGGDNPAYHSSWTNEIVRCELTAPTNGAGLRLSGVTGADVPTANNLGARHLVIYVANSATSIGVDFQGGDTNLFTHCDVGYSGGAGIPFLIGAKATSSTLLRNRTEDIDVAIRTVSGAGYIDAIANMFGTSSTTLAPVELVTGTQYFSFLMNGYSSSAPNPRVVIQPGATNHFVLDKSADQNVRPTDVATASSGDPILRGRVKGDVNPRVQMLATGGILWTDPATGAQQLYLRPTSTSARVLGMADNEFFQVPRTSTTLPTASASRRGCLHRVEGGAGVKDGTYICIKNAADAYEWVNITP